MTMTNTYAKVEPSRTEIDALEGPALIEFGAPWCGHCNAAQPLLASSSLWAGLQAAGTQFDVALRVVRRRVLDAESMAALHTAHATLQVWWDRLINECREHPEVLPASWQTSWIDNRRLARDAVDAFNQLVQAHNAAVMQFPALVLARIFGFRPAGCL